MIVIAGTVLGAIIGALAARKRGGKPADIAQYATATAMIFAMVAMIATIVLHRLAV